MSKSDLIQSKKTIGDSAVDGLVAGIAAGLAMALFLVLAGLLNGTGTTLTLGHFDPTAAGRWLSGLLAHLAVSAIYGMLFGLIRRLGQARLPSSWLSGIAYGLVLYGLAVGIVFPNVASPLAQLGAWQLAGAHLLYGLVLVSWLNRIA